MSDIDNKRPKAILFPKQFYNIPVPFPSDETKLNCGLYILMDQWIQINLTDDNQMCIIAKGESGRVWRNTFPGGKCHY